MDKKPETIRDYRDLTVWKEAMDIAEAIYLLTRTFPREEMFGMTSQMRRCAASIPANIAEGFGRAQRRMFIHFLRIAQGSLKELETHSALCGRVGLLGPEEPSPVRGWDLPLSPALFARDAVILPAVASRAVRFAAEGGPALRVAWEGYRDLGLWSKPEGADFLCIEPWHGMASPVGWDGEFMEKPGILVLAAGESRDFTWSVGPA